MLGPQHGSDLIWVLERPSLVEETDLTDILGSQINALMQVRSWKQEPVREGFLEEVICEKKADMWLLEVSLHGLLFGWLADCWCPKAYLECVGTGPDETCRGLLGGCSVNTSQESIAGEMDTKRGMSVPLTLSKPPPGQSSLEPNRL